MERRQNKPMRPAERPFVLEPADKIGQSLEALDVTFAVRNQFFPLVLKLAGQEINGIGLTHRLFEAIDIYVKTRPQNRRNTIVVEMMRSLPSYLGTLVTETEILEDTLGLLNETLIEPATAELLKRHTLEDDDTLGDNDEGSELPTRGAPRRIKKLMRIPEGQRTGRQQRDIDNWLRRLGKQGLEGATPQGHKLIQPTQWELSSLHASRRRHRGK